MLAALTVACASAAAYAGGALLGRAALGPLSPIGRKFVAASGVGVALAAAIGSL
jgi:hypothetical protein